MGGEKRVSQGGGNNGGFFQLFERNSKSKWRKLFSSKMPLPVESQLENVGGEKIPSTNFHVSDDERRSESSRLSSVSMDDDSVVLKAPNVVARLMGLDSLPLADVSVSNSTSFHDSQSTYGPKKSLEFGPQYQNLHNVKQSNSAESFPSKVTDQWTHKVQRISPFEKRSLERFQNEALPAKRVKSYSDIQHKLLSPIKSSGFVSAKNATHLMETASKILEPSSHPISKSKSTIIIPLVPSRNRLQPGDAALGYNMSKTLELHPQSGKPNVVKFLKGQSINKSWNGPDYDPNYSSASKGRMSKNWLSTLPYENSSESVQTFPSSMKREKLFVSHGFINSEVGKRAVPNNQVKSVSLAVQAKANVQRRENLSCSSIAEPTSTSITSLQLQNQSDQMTLRQQWGGQTNPRRNQKQAISGVSAVLCQNNHKQNKLPSKPIASNQHIRKDMVSDASLGQKPRYPEQARGHADAGRRDHSHLKKVAYCKTAEKRINKNDFQKKTCSPQTNMCQRKMRVIEGGLASNKCGVVNTIFIDDGGKTPVETDEISTAYSNQMESKKKQSHWNADSTSSSSKSMDVVSFTFTSPLSSTSGSQPSKMTSDKQIKKGSSIMMTSDKQNNDNGRLAKSCGEMNVLTAKSSRPSTTCSMSLEGDTLNALLEKKLKELAFGIAMASSCKATKSGTADTVSILQDFLATLNPEVSMSKKLDAESLQISERHWIHDDADSSSSSTPIVNNSDPKIQVEESIMKNFEVQRGDTNLMKVKPIMENDRLSPVSILDAAFSNDSFISLDSSDGTFGVQIDQPCEDMITSMIAANKELLDSAASACTNTVERPGFPAVEIPEEQENINEEMRYIKGVIANTNLMFTDLAVGPSCSIVDPLLFDRLENNIYESVEDQKQIKTERKLLFDGVREYLDSKFCCYNRGDCRAWKRGFSVVEKGVVAEDFFKEMLGWRSMGELTVDEILDKDMSGGTGKWREYENEEFETSLEIEEDILDALIEEVITSTFGLEV